MESGALAALGEADMALREGAEHEVFEHSRSGLRRPGLQQEAAETRNGPGTACREQGGEIGASLEEGPDRHGIGATTELRQVGPGLVGNGAAVGDRESVEASEQPEVIVRTLPRGRALDAVATRAIPLVRREDGGAAAADKRGDQENVVVYVNAGERSIGIEGDILLEEPGSDVGVSIDGETVAAHHHHLISAWARAIAGRVGVRDGVLVRYGVCRLPMPLADVERVFGPPLRKDPGRIFRADARAGVRTPRGPGAAPGHRAVAVQRVPVGDCVTWVVRDITIELEYGCRRYRPCDRGRG